MPRTKGAVNLSVRELRREAKRLSDMARLKERLERLTKAGSGSTTKKSGRKKRSK